MRLIKITLIRISYYDIPLLNVIARKVKYVPTYIKIFSFIFIYLFFKYKIYS